MSEWVDEARLWDRYLALTGEAAEVARLMYTLGLQQGANVIYSPTTPRPTRPEPEPVDHG